MASILPRKAVNSDVNSSASFFSGIISCHLFSRRCSVRDVYINKEATEANSIITPNTDTNLTMTHFEEMAMWFRFYVPYRYNSAIATRQNGIVKLLGKTT